MGGRGRGSEDASDRYCLVGGIRAEEEWRKIRRRRCGIESISMTVEVAGMVALNGNMRTPEGADSILDVMCRGGGGGGSVTVKNSSMPEMSEDMGLCEAVTPDGDSSKEDDEDDEEKIVPSKNMVEIEMRNSKGVGTTKKFEEHETTMILSGMDLVSISFRGLSQLQPSCLTELSLAANRLTTIDLTPFSTCVNLEVRSVTQRFPTDYGAADTSLLIDITYSRVEFFSGRLLCLTATNLRKWT